jgi:Flp pilus assembly protein TadG
MISLIVIADRIRLRNLSHNNKGTAAVEFALIAPILIVLYLGLAELTLGMMAGRRAGHLAATVGDLTAQSESLTTANINDIFDIGASMLSPFPAGANLKIRISSVTMDASGQARVDWSDGKNMGPNAPGTVIAGITLTQLPKGESLMMTEVEYDYDSPVDNFLPGITTFKDKFYHNPRSGAMVIRK